MEEEILAELATGPQLKGKALKAQRAQRAREHQEFFQAGLLQPTPPSVRAAGLAVANEQQTVQAEARPSGLAMVGAAIAGNTSSVIYDALFKNKHEAVKGYKPMWAELPKDADSDLVQRVAGSQSPEETADYVQDAEDERMRVEAVMSRGAGTGIALQFGAEFADATNWVAPFAVAKGLAKLGRGSDVLFQSGKTAEGYTSAITENLLSGTAIEAFKQTAQGEFKPIDLGISLVADGLIGAGTGWLSARNAANRIMDTATESAMVRESSLVTRAEQELGQGAATEDLVAKVAELRKSDANTIIADSVIESNKIIDDVKENINDAANDTPEVKPVKLEETATSQEQVGDKVPNVEATLPTLPRDLSGAKPRYSYGSKPFSLVFDSDIDKAAYIAAQAKPSKRDIDYVAFVSKHTGMDEASVREHGKVVRASIKTQAKYADSGILTIPNMLAQSGDGTKAVNKMRAPTDATKSDANTSIADSVIESNKIIDDIKAPTTPTQQAAPATGLDGDIDKVAQFEDANALAWRAEKFSAGGLHEWAIADRTNGTVTTLDDLRKLPAGVNYIGGAVPVNMRPAVDTAMKLARKFLGHEFRLTINARQIPIDIGNGKQGFANGSLTQVDDNTAMMLVSPDLSPEQTVRTVAHEIGHAIFNKHIGKLPVEQREALRNAFLSAMQKADAAPDGNVGRAGRFSITHVDQGFGEPATPKLAGPYEKNWDEFSAEQLVKYVYDEPEKLGLADKTIKILREAIDQALAFFKLVKRDGSYGVTDEYKAFFDSILSEVDSAPKRTLGIKKASNLDQKDTPSQVVNEILSDPDAVRFGLNLAPVNTPAARAQVQAMLALHKKAEAWEKANPFDDAWKARAKNLADNDVFNVASIGLTMLNSPSPLIRMLASELVEDASGVAGKRRNTAAISKYVLERQMMGNSINDIQNAYDVWKVGKPGANLKDEIFTGTLWDNWNTEISKEIEARLIAGKQVNQDPNVTAAVDSIQASYQRIADAERKFNTLGSEGLPKNSLGYMPHYMNPQAVMNLTNAQRQVLHSTLVDQFVTIEGWDITFADQLASKYMQRVRDRASGDYGSAMGGHGLAEVVQEALVAMQLPEDTITKHMANFHKGAPGHTKGRIKLDLNKVHSTPDGDFKLLDVFETDQIALLRKRAGSASGDVALTKHGIRGRPAVDLVRKALQYGEDGKRIAVGGREFGAFDQMIAEFRNEPFGTQSGKWLDRAMMANTLVRLGGVVFNQLAETLNGIAHLGVIRTFETISSLPRLRREIIALSKGQKVDNPIIGSIEIAGGAEFGTDAYKFVMPFDSPNHAYPSYGQDTLTATDRLLRGGGYLQGKISGWRALHSAQQRGMAEQVTHKMLRYIREGKDDVALQQFGVTPELRNYMKANLDSFAKFDARGRLIEFDATKIADPDMRDSVVQTVHRGVSQIIQGTFIGERGKWAHDGVMKLFTQFRTFPLISMEKQWGRQRNSRGVYGAFGLLLGTMSLSIPIYMARTYASSIGRPDQEAYLEERLAPDVVARATLNYAASSGLIGDFADLLTAPLPEEWGIKPTGGRMNQESDFVGNYIAPASSLVNDIWSYAQSPLELDDAAKIMPFRNVPFLVPLFNQARE